ncbi:unnamed protein product [Paramecium primaurelia]|uniref:Uncharacterized protein n=1 Tax=Paramecium primaurelia TaxID=5886 RepID=A0A8S1NGR9_PARPR|nr:unnamed protein product [Paramecium primaurelia]
MIKLKLIIFQIICNSIAAIVISAIFKEYISISIYGSILLFTILFCIIKQPKLQQVIQFILIIVIQENSKYNQKEFQHFQFQLSWIYLAYKLIQNNPNFELPILLELLFSSIIKIIISFEAYNSTFYLSITTTFIYTLSIIAYQYQKRKESYIKSLDLELVTPKMNEFQRILINKTQPTRSNEIQIFDHLPIGLVVLTFDHNFQYMNKRARILLERASNTQISEDNVVIIIKELLKKCINEKITSLGNLFRPSQTRIHQLITQFNQNQRVSMPNLDDNFIKQIDPINSVLNQSNDFVPYSQQYMDNKYRIQYNYKGKKRCFRFHFMRLHDQIIINLLDETSKIGKLDQKSKHIFQNQLLNSFSHELKTPLNCIQQLLEVVMLKVNSDLQENILKPIKWQTDLLLCQINDILDYASFEINDFRWDFSLFYLEDLLKECISIYFQACKEKDINLKLEMNSQDKQMVNNDYKRMKQVIVNLLNNSIKFTQQQGEIVLKVQETKNNMYQIQVIDTGLGLSQEQLWQLQINIEQDNLESVYNQFHVGLGLKVANRLIRGMSSLQNGLNIDSTLNKGTIISFIIEDFLEDNNSQSSETPIKDAQLSRQLSQLTTREFKFIKQIICKCNKILIVDDIPFNHHALKMILNELNYQADSVYDGQQAIDLIQLRIQNNKCHPFYSLILMDIEMPKLNGFEASLKIKQILGDKSDQTTIIMCSAYDNQECIKMCQSCLMKDVLPKPITKMSLQYIIEKYLR